MCGNSSMLQCIQATRIKPANKSHQEMAHVCSSSSLYLTSFTGINVNIDVSTKKVIIWNTSKHAVIGMQSTFSVQPLDNYLKITHHNTSKLHPRHYCGGGRINGMYALNKWMHSLFYLCATSQQRLLMKASLSQRSYSFIFLNVTLSYIYG